MKRIALLAIALLGTITAGAAQAQPMMNHGCYRHFRVALVDEYGFRYDARGDRLNAEGCIIAPPHTPPGARAIQD
jgi:hypothetical protein